MGATWAEGVRAGSAEILARVTAAVLPLRPDNLVERPWGGTHLARFKALADAPPGMRYGESFEVASDRRDEETRAHPSTVVFPDQSTLPLPDLLDRAGAAVLGGDLFAAEGPELALLPKLLDVKQMLSVQGHPPGNPEVYVVLEAEPGATIRIGFTRDLDRATAGHRWLDGRRAQERVVGMLRAHADLKAVQAEVGHALGAGAPAADIAGRLAGWTKAGADRAAFKRAIEGFVSVYRDTLDLLGTLAVSPGMVIVNATPPEAGHPPCAEVHALGNPQDREILLLELRRPGPTYRLWDHARFPPRPLQVEEGLAVLPLAARSPGSFVVEPTPIPGRPGAALLFAGPPFVAERLRPTPELPVALPGHDAVTTLHVTRGAVVVGARAGGAGTTLPRGHSALLPAGVGALILAAAPGHADAEAVAVTPTPGAGRG